MRHPNHQPRSIGFHNRHGYPIRNDNTPVYAHVYGESMARVACSLHDVAVIYSVMYIPLKTNQCKHKTCNEITIRRRRGRCLNNIYLGRTELLPERMFCHTSDPITNTPTEKASLPTSQHKQNYKEVKYHLHFNDRKCFRKSRHSVGRQRHGDSQNETHTENGLQLPTIHAPGALGMECQEGQRPIEGRYTRNPKTPSNQDPKGL